MRSSDSLIDNFTLINYLLFSVQILKLSIRLSLLLKKTKLKKMVQMNHTVNVAIWVTMKRLKVTI